MVFTVAGVALKMHGIRFWMLEIATPDQARVDGVLHNYSLLVFWDFAPPDVNRKSSLMQTAAGRGGRSRGWVRGECLLLFCGPKTL